MTVQLPSLGKDGAVVFASPDQLESTWTTYIAKGALPVRPDRTLAPLEQLEVRLTCAGVVQIAVRVEVVQLGKDRALLRLLDPPPPMPALPKKGGWELPPMPTLAPSAKDSQQIGSVMPDPLGDGFVAPLPSPAGLAGGHPQTPSPVVAVLSPPRVPEATAAPAMQTLPPYFTGDALKFQSGEDLRGARQYLESVGAVMAVCDGKIPSGPVEVRLAVGPRESRGRVKVTLAAAAPGTAVVQAVERGAFGPLLMELDSLQTAAHTPAHGIAGPATPATRSFSLPKAGTLENPQTPEGILALPISRAPADMELARPSVPLLLRWLRTTRGVLRLEVAAEDHPVFTAVFVEGREVRTPATFASLGKSMALKRMTYTVTELGRAPTMTTNGRTLHLICEVLRGLVTQAPLEDLARAFPKHPDKCARAIMDVVNGLGLPAQHLRFIKTDVDGSQFLDEITHAAVGGRTVWETLYVLELYNALAWDDPATDKKTTRTSPISLPTDSKTGPINLDDAAWAPFAGKDHFGVLGLHWSSSPTEVQPAYTKLRSEYGPGGPKRPLATATADKITKRIDEAYRVLNDPGQRRAYRRDKYNLVWAHQAQLLVQKAKLALYRQDVHEAMNILLAAEDMSPSHEAQQMLAKIKQALAGS